LISSIKYQRIQTQRRLQWQYEHKATETCRGQGLLVMLPWVERLRQWKTQSNKVSKTRKTVQKWAT
jgi:hypothetical protein